MAASEFDRTRPVALGLRPRIANAVRPLSARLPARLGRATNRLGQHEVRGPSERSRLYPWRTRGWPATAADEETFAVDLTELSGVDVHATASPDDAAPPVRRVVTPMILALRSGMSLGELLDVAPGLTAADFAVAYQRVESLRNWSAVAWAELVRCTSAQSFERHQRRASLLLPILVSRVGRDIRRWGDVQRIVKRASSELARVSAYAIRLEQQVRDAARAGRPTALLTDELFNAECTGAWDDDSFLPSRVGTLTPQRLQGLLLEP